MDVTSIRGDSMKKVAIFAISLLMLASTAYAENPITLFINGKQVVPSVSPQIINGTTMVPLRVISESLGAEVQWDEQTRRVTVTTAPAASQGLTLAELNEIGESVGIIWAYDGDQLVSQGSGFVVDDVLVTNVHVIENATQFVVAFGEEQTTIQVNDALFRNDEKDLIGFAFSGAPSLRLSTEEPKYKDHVYTLSFPKGKFTLTEGKILQVTDQLITHDAGQDPGSSGGMLVNSNGEVIGVLVSGSDNIEINEAVPIIYVKQQLDNFN